MQRRDFARSVSALLAASSMRSAFGQPNSSASSDNLHDSVPTGPPQQIGMLIYPKMTALDFVGPHTFLSGLMNVDVHVLWKTKDIITTDSGLRIQPSTALSECPKDLDILFVPGGTKGTIALMDDPEGIAFLADRGSRARYVTSVCTGSMLLGAAGLLKGYKATSHWYVRDLLPIFGATAVPERVVIDRNRITGGGVTSGIDFGLTLSAKMRDERFAQMQQLAFEYDPQPPFHGGTPEKAAPKIVHHMRTMMAANHRSMKAAAEQAHKRLGLA